MHGSGDYVKGIRESEMLIRPHRAGINGSTELAEVPTPTR